MHEGTEVAAEHHHVSGDDIVLAAVHPFLTSALTPQRSVYREHHIAVTGHVVAHELSVVEPCRPFVGIVGHLLLHAKWPYHLLLADIKMCAMVVQGIDGGERSIAIGNKEIGRHPRVGIDIE